MLERLKEEVLEANLELDRRGIVLYTWGNVSGVDFESRNMIIKPSGVPYASLRLKDMCVVNIDNGKLIEGSLRPSSDTPTHLELYRAFPEIGGITHTHSVNAVAFAQAGDEITSLGTTHADYFYHSIPCTRLLSEEEIRTDYERNVGKVIVDTLVKRNINPTYVPGILVNQHGPFTWGKNAFESVFHSVILETVAEMALKTLIINPESKEIDKFLLEKHFLRKHGPRAYYGQAK